MHYEGISHLSIENINHTHHRKFPMHNLLFWTTCSVTVDMKSDQRLSCYLLTTFENLWESLVMVRSCWNIFGTGWNLSDFGGNFRNVDLKITCISLSQEIKSGRFTKPEAFASAHNSFYFFSCLQACRILLILQSDWFRERVVFYNLAC